MSQSQPKSGHIGVVTVTYNSDDMLSGFLGSLGAQTYRDFTLYVVDNVSTDATLSTLRAYSGMDLVIVANTENVGIAEGCNQGIRRAYQDGCTEVLLINNDVTFEPSMLQKLHDGLARHQCDMTTGKMYYFDRPNVFWFAGGEYLPWPRLGNRHIGVEQEDTGQFDQDRQVTYTPTTLMLAKMSVFERVGLMDPQYFVSFEDTDFMLRCNQQGMTLWYIAAAKLWHKVGTISAPRRAYVEYLFVRNFVYFTRKHLSVFRAGFLYALHWSRFLFSRLTGRSDRETWLSRRKGLREGLKMKILPDGPKL